MFSEETANGVQLTDMTSHDPSVSNIKTSTMKKQKSSKKKSSGFENPIYYSPKVRERVLTLSLFLVKPNNPSQHSLTAGCF